MLLVLPGLLAFASGCAQLGGNPVGPSLGSESRPLVRPDLGPDYDVLVGEMMARDGDIQSSREAFARALEKDPESAYLNFRLARLDAQADDMDAALRHAERGLELAPDDEDGRLFLGRLHRLRRDLAGIERVLRDASGKPVSASAAMLLYQVYLDQSKLPEALEVAHGLIEVDATDWRGYVAQATVYERMQRFDDAERVLRQALDFHPNRFVLFSRLSRLRRAAGDRDGELALYREVLEEYPGHYGTLVSLGEVQIAQNDLEGAIATYQQIIEHFPDDLQAIRRLAGLEFAAGRYESARERLQRALTRNPEHWEFAYSLGQVLRGLGQSEAALAEFRRIPSSHPLYVEAHLQIAVALEEASDLEGALAEIETVRAMRPDRGLDFNAASLHARTGNFEKGIALLEEMLEANPDDDEVLYQLGVLYGLRKDQEKALWYMQEVLKRNADNAHALNYIGYSWAEKGENLEQAEEMISRAVKLNPRDGYIADSLGWVYYMRAVSLIDEERRGEGMVLLEQARKQLYIAAELTGGDPVVSEHLGDVYLLLEQPERALEYYEQAVELKPREDEQPDLLEKLDRLRREVGTPEQQAE